LANSPEAASLTGAHVEAELTSAALAAGLGDAEIAATLRSALDAGEREPRTAPDDGGRHSPTWFGHGDVTGDDAAAIGLGRRTGDAWFHRYEAHEADLCDAFLEMHGDNWRFVDKIDVWIGWNGTHWQEDESLRLRHDLIMMQAEAHAALRDEAEALIDEAGGDKEALQEAKAAMAAAMAWKPTIMRTAAATKQAEAKRAIHRDRLAAGNLLNLANGCLDLRTFELRPHRRDDLLTHCLDYAFDAGATCPTWERFIREVLVDEKLQPDAELAALAQEAIGYSLTTETNREAFFFLSGSGGNGKSTLLTTVAALLGTDLSMTLDLEALAQYGADYRLAMIRGKRIVFSTEARPEAKIADGIFRRIASGETLDARPIGKEPIQITPVCKIWWSQNAQPHVADTSDAFWRRLKLLPFRRQFSEHEKDIDLADKLRSELPGILNWALAGLRRLRTVGRFTASAQAATAAAEYRTASNPIALWVNECTTLGLPDAKRRELDAKRLPLADSDIGWSQARAAYDNYRGWCVDTGRHEKNQTAFGRELSAELRRRGAGDKETKRNVAYYPFGLTAPALPKTVTAGDAAAIGLTKAADGSPSGGICCKNSEFDVLLSSCE
jgi:putative DNA primase/helicase